MWHIHTTCFFPWLVVWHIKFLLLFLLLTLYNTEVLMVCQQPVLAAKLKAKLLNYKN